MNFLNTIVYKGKLSKTKKHFGFRLYKPTIWTALVLTNLQFSKELSKGKPFVICEIQVNLNLKKKRSEFKVNLIYRGYK